MKEDFTDRLLDSALRHYSSVEVPEGFAERLAAREAGYRLQAAGRKWWMLVPAAAALAAVLVFWPRPVADTPPTVAVVRPHPPPPIPQLPASPWRRAVRVAKPKWRTLTAIELASADFPLEILRPMESKPIKDLEIPELEIKPLAGAVEETVPKEPQQ